MYNGERKREREGVKKEKRIDRRNENDSRWRRGILFPKNCWQSRATLMDVVIDFTEEKEGSTNLSLSLIFISRHRLFRKKEQSLRARLSALKSLSRLGSTLDPRLKFWIQTLGLARSTSDSWRERRTSESRFSLAFGRLVTFVRYVRLMDSGRACEQSAD